MYIFFTLLWKHKNEYASQFYDVKHYLLHVLVQFDEQKDQVVVEQVLRVVFLDPERPTLVSWMEISPICHFPALFILFCFVCILNYATFNLIFVKALEKLRRQLAEAEAALESRKKPPEEAGPRIVGEGLVIDEWVRHSTCIFDSSDRVMALNFYRFLLVHILTCDTCNFHCRKSEGKDT